MKVLFAIERAILFAVALSYAISFFSSISGCAGHRKPASDRIPQGEKFWNGCEQTTSANPDGFQHFICTDVNNRQWEVLVRREAQ